MKLRAFGALVLALPLAYVGGVPSAHAEICDRQNHCYGVAFYPTGGPIDGFWINAWTDCLHLDDPDWDFAQHEHWVITDAKPGTRTWFEAGYKRGVGGNLPDHSFRLFWSEHTGTAYEYHNVEPAYVALWRNWKFYRIREAGPDQGRWRIYRNDNLIALTTQKSYGTYVHVGAETTTGNVYSHGKSQNIWVRKEATGWEQRPLHSAPSTDTYTVTATNATMEQWSNNNMCPGVSGPPTALSVKAPTVSDVRNLAMQMARENGEKNPVIEQVTATKRQATTNARLASDHNADVYYVKMTGNFVGHLASRPIGTEAPTGRYLTMTVSRTDGSITDWSLSTTEPVVGKAASLPPAETAQSDSNKIIPTPMPSIRH